MSPEQLFREAHKDIFISFAKLYMYSLQRDLPVINNTQMSKALRCLISEANNREFENV